MELKIEATFKIPVWITLPALPWEFRSADSLSAIASLLGRPLYSDQCTRKRTRLAYARVLVEMGLGGSLTEYILLEDGKGAQFKQNVEYEWKPQRCSKCNGFLQP